MASYLSDIANKSFDELIDYWGGAQPGSVKALQVEFEIRRRELLEQTKLANLQSEVARSSKEASVAAEISADAALRSARAAERTASWTMASALFIAATFALSAWSLIQAMPRG